MNQNEYREKPASDLVPEQVRTKKLWADVRTQFIGKQFGERGSRAQLLEKWSTTLALNIDIASLQPAEQTVVWKYLENLASSGQEFSLAEIEARKPLVQRIVESYVEEHQNSPGNEVNLVHIQEAVATGKLLEGVEGLKPAMKLLLAAWIGILLVITSSATGVLTTKHAYAADTELVQTEHTTHFKDFEQSSEEPPISFVEVMAAFTTLYQEPQRGSGIVNVPPQGAQLETSGEIDSTGKWIKVTGVNGMDGWVPLANVKIHIAESAQNSGSAHVEVMAAMTTMYEEPRRGSGIVNIPPQGAQLETSGEIDTTGDWIKVTGVNGMDGWIPLANVKVLSEQIAEPELPDGATLQTTRVLDIVDNIADTSGIYAFEGERLTYTGISKGEWLQIIRSGGRVGWIKRADVIVMEDEVSPYLVEDVPSTAPSESAPIPVRPANPVAEPTPEPIEVVAPDPNVESIFFTTSQEANRYLRLEEIAAGYDRARMTPDQLIAHRNETRVNTERTLRFVVGRGLWDDMIAKGIDPEEFMRKHVNILNKIYSDAQIPIHYTLNPTLVVPWVNDHNFVKHGQDGVVLNSNNEKLQYSFTDDSTWVLTDNCNDGDFPNYADKIIHRLAEFDGIDPGLIHELVHHTGIYDIYHSNTDLHGMSNLTQITAYPTDIMSGDMGLLQLTPAGALGIHKLMENNLFGPQHDGDFVARVDNFSNEVHITHALANKYNVYFIHPNGKLLTDKIRGLYYLNEDNTAVSEPMQKDGAYLSIESDMLHRNLVWHAIIKFGSLSIPLERFFLIYSNIYQTTKLDSVPINIQFHVDPESYTGDALMNIDMINLSASEPIPVIYSNKKVIASAKIPNTDVIVLWSMN